MISRELDRHWGSLNSWRAVRSRHGTQKLDGLILSPMGLAATRALVGQKMLLVTPGVRPEGVQAADQKRVMTPVAAIAAGADYLVVGRPVTHAPDPAKAARDILAEIATASAAA